MRKKIIVLSLVLIMILSTSIIASQPTQNGIKFQTFPYELPQKNNDFVVTIDGEPIIFNDTFGYPFINKNSRTIIPLRFISENMGYDVSWDNPTQTATIKNDDTTVTIKIGDTMATVNGKKVPMDIQDGKVVDTKAVLLKDRTYVPLRFVSETLGATIEYKRGVNVNIIDIKTPNPDTTPEELPFPEPEIITVFPPQIRGTYGSWFRIELRNLEEYKDMGINVTAKMIGGNPDWVKFKVDDFTTAKKGDYVIFDNVKWHTNQDYEQLDSQIRAIFIFDVNSRSIKIDSTTNEKVVLPKEGDILVFQIDFTANNHTKTYIHKVRIREDVDKLFAEDAEMNLIPWDDWAYSAKKNK